MSNHVLSCQGGDNRKWPPWLGPLLQTSFFGQCEVHTAGHKNECNMYCLDCINGPLCSLCLNSHKGHRSIQPRPAKGVTNTCQVCHRSLIDSFNFCSLGCKIAGISNNFQKEKVRMDIDGRESDESTPMHNKDVVIRSKIHSFTPSTPPRTVMMNFRSTKRRKGVPHRAPTGGLFIEC